MRIGQNVLMEDKHPFSLRQIDQARGDLYAIADEIEILKLKVRRGWARNGMAGPSVARLGTAVASNGKRV